MVFVVKQTIYMDNVDMFNLLFKCDWNEKGERHRGQGPDFDLEIYKKDNILTVHWVSLFCFCSKENPITMSDRWVLMGVFNILWN